MLWDLLARFLARPAVVDWLIRQGGKRPYFDLYDPDGSLYMARDWLIPELRWLPWAARLHHIARADVDRDVHDHPCDYRTIRVRNWYDEQDVFGKVVRREQGTTNAARAQNFHRITAVAPGGVWTVFIYRHRMPHNPWGFLAHTPDGVRKIFWRDYLGH